MIVVLWGVSGCGKSTIGTMLSADLGWSFLDADDFHPQSSIDKMQAGVPLTDADRAPWLTTLADELEHALQREQSLVLACSALKRTYRQQLQRGREQIRFVHLAGSFELITERLRARAHEFMNPNLLSSQFETLEPSEQSVVVDIAAGPEQVCAEIKRALSL